jgi:hypothetical protein
VISKKLLFGLMITVLLLLAACHKFTGGGWIDGMNGGKATFSFVAQCEDTDEGVVVLGDFQFNDISARVRFHGEFEYYYDGVVESCHHLADSLPDQAQLVGTCKTQPGNVEGQFNLIVSDVNGWTDYINVITNCTPDGTEYSNGGELRGGNITAHKG